MIFLHLRKSRCKFSKLVKTECCHLCSNKELRSKELVGGNNNNNYSKLYMSMKFEMVESKNTELICQKSKK